MNKILIAVAFVLLGSCERNIDGINVGLNGYTERCIDNVKYIVFTTGASVKYDRSGEIVLCQE